MALALSACGAKIAKDAPPPPTDRVLAEAASPQANAQLTWVLVSESPGSWAEEAVWDEYLVRVRNTSTAPISITGAVLEDSSGTPATPLASRKELIKGSKQMARRYKDQGVTVYTGLGGAGMGTLGAASTAGGVAYASTLSLGLMGGASSSSLAFGAAFGLIATGPVLGTVGIVRSVRASKMNKRIQARATPLPVTVAPGAAVMLDLFFPISPAPNALTVGYRAGDAEERVVIDTRQALAGLHLPLPEGAVAAAPVPVTTQAVASAAAMPEAPAGAAASAEASQAEAPKAGASSPR
ncbi:hypothetical protein ASD14_12250 [Lysobacter sp. Root494]|nr:hypothetical protein ASD14_12250 [Lysobacter sp. Root494]